MHNFNTFAVAVEMVLGGTRLSPGLASIAPLYGLAYFLFAWIWGHRMSPKHGVQYFYDFFDTTLSPTFQVGAFFGLIAVLFLFFFLAVAAGAALDYAEEAGYKWQAGGALVVASSLIMRFRD